MEQITLLAPAKINLGLDVLGRRADGYHELRMVMQTVDLRDRVTLQKRGDTEIGFACADRRLSDPETNLCVRAARLFLQESGLCAGTDILLEKYIPMEAGLAGGSTDAAAVLIGMNRLFETGYSMEKLQAMGVRLGADIPYCIQGGTALAEGIGEKITELPLWKGLPLVIAKPQAGAGTGAIYSRIDALEDYAHPDTPELIDAIIAQDRKRLGRALCNVLELATIPLVPEIGEIKNALLDAGAAGSLMSGSGSAVFGIFETAEQAEQAAGQLKTDHPQWFVQACGTCAGMELETY